MTAATHSFKVIYAARVVFIWLLLATGIAVLVASSWNWFSAHRDNAVSADLLAGRDVEINPEKASNQILFARAYYLLKRDRLDEAQILLDQANFRGNPKTRVVMLYNMANARLREGFVAIEDGKFDKAAALVELAKADYTNALRLDPNAWNVKFNLDVAARLVRDLPQRAVDEDPSGKEPPKDIWTDLPGIPRGAP